MPDEQASEATSSLTRKFSFPGENARFCDPDREENDLFAAWKGIVSDWARNAPLLHLNYRDTRTVMIQNAHGIATNDSILVDVTHVRGLSHVALLVSSVGERRERSGQRYFASCDVVWLLGTSQKPANAGRFAVRAQDVVRSLWVSSPVRGRSTTCS